MRRLPLLLSLGLGALAAVAQMSGALRPANDTLYDQLCALMPARGDLPAVVVVAIDDPSFAEIGTPWPWPRSVHARAIEAIRAAGARRIGYDIVFADPGPPPEDAALADALGADVVLAAYTAEADTPQGVMRMMVGPHPGLLQSGTAVGSIDVPVDPDGAIRRLPAGPTSFSAILAGQPRTPPADARIRFDAAGVTTVSFYQALDAGTHLPAAALRDKVVLVGTVLKSQPTSAADMFRTPLTATGHGFMSGVQIHAHAYRTLAAQAWIRTAPDWVAAGLALILALATPIAAAVRSGTGAVASVTGVALLPLALSGAALLGGVWIAPLAAVAATLTTGGAVIAANFLRERRARHEITRIFGHYLAPALVQRLAENPDALELGGERRVVTVLFCDLRGFTRLSERMRDDPATLTRIVNTALGALAESVMANRGMVDKFIGDCVMALWNAPADDPDHAANAIAAGRDMVRAIAALSEKLSAEGIGVTLACGVGINTGECTVGNMGSALRFDYTAIGDPVNLAARLENLTKDFGTAILIGQETARRVPGTGLVELGTVAIRGRETPETVFGLRDLMPCEVAS